MESPILAFTQSTACALRKGYRGWGAELTNEVTMIDADMRRFIKLDKDDFTGKAATLAQKEEDRTLQLVYFEVEASDSDVRGNEPIFSGDDVIGLTTSGGYGHFTAKSLGFRLRSALHCPQPGTELTNSAFSMSAAPRAYNCTDPAHDPSNERLRA